MATSTVTGFENVIKLFEEISDSDVRKVLNEAGADIENIMKNNIAIDTSTAQKSIKKRVRKTAEGIKLTVRVGKRYYINQEYGSSTADPSNIGKLSKALRGKDAEVIKALERLVKKWEVK